MFYGKVDFVISDKPLLADTVYADRYTTSTRAGGIRAAVTSFYTATEEAGHHHRHILLKRDVPYTTSGRNEDEATARLIDDEIVSSLRRHNFDFVTLTPSPDSARQYVDSLLNPLTTTSDQV